MLRARLILSAIWWSWGLALFVILAVLSSNEGTLDPAKAWGWFLPNMIPALTLMGAVALNQPGEAVRPTNRMPILLIALGTTIAYLSLMTIAVFAPFSTTDPIGHMLQSNLYLTPLQALTLSTVGIFFNARDAAGPGHDPKDEDEKGRPRRAALLVPSPKPDQRE